MAKVRKDNKGRNLRPGETQRADGSYMYVYKLGTKKKYLYDSDLASLRVKEKQINKDKDDGIRTQEAMKLTLNDMFKVYMNNNIKLKPSTRANYLYLWDFYVKEEPFANMPLPQIHRSDILAFYTKLLKHGFAINSLESINTIVHPTLEMAVDDDYIRKNPSKGIYRKLKTDGSAPKPKRRIALTKTQQQNFLRFIAKSPTYSHWLPIMTVLLGTGMRVAECTGITKSDINLSENTISVNHNLIYRVIDGKAGFHITTPKTESGTRIIPILYPEVAEQLRLQIETIDALYPDDQLVLGGVHGFVFRNRTGSFMSAHNINRAIERISVTYNMEEMDQAELEDREPDLLSVAAGDYDFVGIAEKRAVSSRVVAFEVKRNQSGKIAVGIRSHKVVAVHIISAHVIVECGLQVALLFNNEHLVDEPEIGFGAYGIDDVAGEHLIQVAVGVVVIPRSGVAAIGIKNLYPVTQCCDGSLVVGLGLFAPTVAHHLRLRRGIIIRRIHRRKGPSVGIVAQQDVDKPFGRHTARIIGRLLILADAIFLL